MLVRTCIVHGMLHEANVLLLGEVLHWVGQLYSKTALRPRVYSTTKFTCTDYIGSLDYSKSNCLNAKHSTE